MAEDDQIPISALASDKLHGTVPGGAYFGSRWCTVVDTLVRSPLLENWVESGIGESRRDPGELKWGAEEGLA